MGLAISNSFVENTVNSLTSVLNTTVSDVTQDLQTNCTSKNTFTGVFGAVLYTTNGETKALNCPISASSLEINQNAQNTCSIKGGLTSDLTVKITNNLNTNVNQWLDQQVKAGNGFVSAGVAIALSEGINTADLSTKISNALTSNLSQACSAVLDSGNEGIVYVCGSYPNGIVITQSALNINLTSCMIKNLITNVTDDTVLNGIVQKAKAKVTAENEGLGSLLKWLIIAGIVLGVIIIVAVLMFFIFGSKGSGKPADQAKQDKKASLERRLLEKREGGIASKGSLEGLEKGAEARTGKTSYLRRMGEKLASKY